MYEKPLLVHLTNSIGEWPYNRITKTNNSKLLPVNYIECSALKEKDIEFKELLNEAIFYNFWKEYVQKYFKIINFGWSNFTLAWTHTDEINELREAFIKSLRWCCFESWVKRVFRNSYFYIEKWTLKVMCEVYYRAKRDKKEATWL